MFLCDKIVALRNVFKLFSPPSNVFHVLEVERRTARRSSVDINSKISASRVVNQTHELRNREFSQN
jgi:hypothetical protein